MPRPIPRNTSTDSTNRIITRRPDIVHTPWRGIFIGLVALIVVIIIAVSVSKHRSTSQHQSMRYINRSTITSTKPAQTQKNTSWTGKKPSSSKVSTSRAKSSGTIPNTKKTSATNVARPQKSKDNIIQKTTTENQPATSAPKPTIKYGYIVITSQPSGAEVYIDDTYKGHTACTIRLPTGAHVISLKMSGYLPWDATVNVSSDKPVELTRKLIQEP